jgi:hypothetical protein
MEYIAVFGLYNRKYLKDKEKVINAQKRQAVNYYIEQNNELFSKNS